MVIQALRNIFLAGIFAAAAAFSLSKTSDAPALDANTLEEREVLYLPSGKALNLLSLGYKNVLADILWFKTINYFGRHFRSDQKYIWLGHMCDLVTDLDPRAPGIAEFCAAMLSWEAEDPARAVKILTKAIDSRPPEYFTLYLRGFTALHFLNDLESAKKDFVAASNFPDADITVKRLAASATVLSGDPRTAITLILDLLRRATDGAQKRALEARLLDARYELDLRNIDQAAAVFFAQYQRNPGDISDLVQSGIIKSLPKDPFGGSYYLRAEDGKAASTSAHPRLKIFKNKE